MDNLHFNPLKAYEDLKAFKLFLLDVGLLSCMVRLKQGILLEGNEMFKEFKRCHLYL